MVLSDEGIRQAIAAGELEIHPQPVPDQYTTSAVDLVLGNQFSMWDRNRIEVPGTRIDLNLAEQEFQRTATAFLIPADQERDGSIILRPYSGSPWLLLAMTRERVNLKHNARLAARVEGRSSLARLGLVVHLTAPTIHAGFNGSIALEMINFGPFQLRLVPNKTRICQLIFERLETKPRSEIDTAFQGQASPAGR